MTERQFLSNGSYHVMVTTSGYVETRTEVVVSLDDPVELRRVVLANLCNRSRILSATSYAEIVLCAAAMQTIRRRWAMVARCWAQKVLCSTPWPPFVYRSSSNPGRRS